MTVRSSDLQVLLLVAPTGTPGLSDLQKTLAADPIIATLHRETLADIQPFLDEILPDMVFLFADALEAVGEDVAGFCKSLHEAPTKYRPILILASDAQAERRIDYLTQGADDVLSAHLEVAELYTRLLAHLRRNLEVHTNEVTRLPGLGLASRILQRRINRAEDWALLVVELDQFNVYSEVYGPIPGDQVLRTFAALLGRFVLLPDFASQSEENTFLVLTHPDKAEKIASLLCRQFEAVAPNFYSEKDRKQGYIISVVDEKISRRVPLLSLGIGIVSSQSRRFESFLAAFHAAQQMKELARMTPGSSWLSERPRLSGEHMGATRMEQSLVLVLESDAALAYLLKTTLEMEGYDVAAVSAVSEARDVLQARSVKLLISDALLNGEETGLLFCREVRAQWPDLPIICISSLHNRDQVLGAGADLYLPKPFELLALFSWAARLLKGQ